MACTNTGHVHIFNLLIYFSKCGLFTKLFPFARWPTVSAHGNFTNLVSVNTVTVFGLSKNWVLTDPQCSNLSDKSFVCESPEHSLFVACTPHFEHQFALLVEISTF